MQELSLRLFAKVYVNRAIRLTRWQSNPVLEMDDRSDCQNLPPSLSRFT